MALRLPVAASPIQAYEEIVRSGRNGFICRTADEWIQALRCLEDDRTRERIANCGYRYVRRRFSIETIGPQWIRVLSALYAGSTGVA